MLTHARGPKKADGAPPAPRRARAPTARSKTALTWGAAADTASSSRPRGPGTQQAASPAAARRRGAAASAGRNPRTGEAGRDLMPDRQPRAGNRAAPNFEQRIAALGGIDVCQLGTRRRLRKSSSGSADRHTRLFRAAPPHKPR